jgi:hypothetical protein
MLDTVASSSRSSSNTRTMPFVRQRRPHLTSTRTNQIEVQGTTYLCFPLDHSWFQGNINTDDDSSYTIYGERVSPDPQQEQEQHLEQTKKPEENNNHSNGKGEGETDQGSMTDDLNKTLKEDGLQKGYFKVVLTDHFTGLSYHLTRIGVNLKNNGITPGEDANIFTCTDSDADVKFRVENIYKGQKADMVIQKCLGSSALLGQKNLVYSGPISITFTEVIENARSWCL